MRINGAAEKGSLTEPPFTCEAWTRAQFGRAADFEAYTPHRLKLLTRRSTVRVRPAAPFIYSAINRRYLALFPLSEEHHAVSFKNIFESSLYETRDFLGGSRHFTDELIFFLTLCELHILQGVLNVFMSKRLHHMQNVLCFLVFHASLLVTQRVKN